MPGFAPAALICWRSMARISVETGLIVATPSFAVCWRGWTVSIS
jgi:hypothetical protein